MKLRIACGLVLIAVLFAWFLHRSRLPSTHFEPGGIPTHAPLEFEPLSTEPGQDLVQREVATEVPVAEVAPSAPHAVTEEWSIVGTVTDEESRPISGAVVVPDSRQLIRLSTDERGEFRFAAPDLRPFTYLKSFSVMHPDFLAQRAVVELGEEFYAAHTRAMSITLHRGLRVSVSVIDEQAQPIEGAYVRIRGLDEDLTAVRPNPWISQEQWRIAESFMVREGLECASALTDVRGIASLQLSNPASYMLVAWKSGYSTEPEISWGIVGSGDTTTCELRRGLSISGIVIDSTKLAVPDVSIVVETVTRSGGKYAQQRASTTTNELGKFTIAGLGFDPVRTTLTAHHPERGGVNERIENPSEPQTVLLVPHLELHFRLLDFESKSPIEGTAKLTWAPGPRDNGSANVVGVREHAFSVLNCSLSATIPRFIEAATLSFAGYDDVDIDLRPYVDLPSLDQTLELCKQLRYEVRIIDAETGAPLRGAKLQLGCAWLNAGGGACTSSSLVPSEWRGGAEVFVLEGVQLHRSTAISLSAMHGKFKNKSIRYKSPENGDLLGDVVIAMERLP